jgi:hypothetical protein
MVLYGCETWYVTLREEHRLREFKKMLMRGIFGPKRDKVSGGWRKLSVLYSPPNIIRIIMSWRMRWAGHVMRIGEKRNAYRLLVGKPE